MRGWGFWKSLPGGKNPSQEWASVSISGQWSIYKVSNEKAVVFSMFAYFLDSVYSLVLSWPLLFVILHQQQSPDSSSFKCGAQTCDPSEGLQAFNGRLGLLRHPISCSELLGSQPVERQPLLDYLDCIV